MNAEMTSASVRDPAMNSHGFDADLQAPVTRITRPSISISRPVRLSGRRSHTTAPSAKNPTPIATSKTAKIQPRSGSWCEPGMSARSRIARPAATIEVAVTNATRARGLSWRSGICPTDPMPFGAPGP